jgi:SAM-dependent methyltransferase
MPPRTGLARAKVTAKAALDRWPAAKALAYVADDFGRGLRQRLGRIGSESGSTHRALAVAESVGYVEAVFGDYMTYGGLDHLGGIAAEVGPGDNAGVGLLLRAAGCESVELIDRFRSYRSPDQQRRIYQALADRHQVPGPQDGGWDDTHLPGVVWRLGSSAEEYFARQAHRGGRRYDLIVSRAALEHLYDPLAALRSMAACLSPGGRMLHKIDFRDHGMFTPAHPELTFLHYPGPLYRRMTQRSGRPNRVLLHRYRSLAGELAGPSGLDTTILVTSLAGAGEITPHVPFAEVPAAALRRAVRQVDAERRHFAAEFAAVSSADLAVTGIFWVGTKR